MLEELRFVQGAVAKKNLLPHLTHFKIENGTVRSFNGTLALSSPIDLDIDCIPKAIPFYKAIQNCKETVSLSMTAAGRLSVKSGAFKAFIETVDEETPHVIPEGEEIEINGDVLLAALKIIEPFIGDDAARPWSNGVLLKGQSAFATNNVSAIEYWIGSSFPRVCNLPRAAIKEMIRINQPPKSAQITDISISFHYEDDKWIRSALLDLQWPDIATLLDRGSNPVPVNPLIFEGLEVLKPFVDKLERVYITDGVMSTTLIEDEGASFDLDDFPYEGVYQISILNLLNKVATSVDFSTYPKPCLFYGENLRGALMGMSS